MCSGCASTTRTSPPVMSPDARYVAETTRSVTTSWSRGAQLVDAVDREPRRAEALDARAHGDELAAEVFDLGLARGVVDDRAALGEDAGHQQVVGRGVARVLERDARRAKSRCASIVARMKLRSLWNVAPIAVRPSVWKLIGRWPKSSPPGKRHVRLAAAREQRSEHDDRGAHRLEEVRRRDGMQVGGVGHDDESSWSAGRVDAHTRARPAVRSSSRRR